MTSKKFFISVVAVFGFIYAVDFFWHGILLKDMYQQTSKLWRSGNEMRELLPFCVAIHLAFSAIIVTLFKNFVFTGGKKATLRNCLIVGLSLGELVGILELGMFIYMPIPVILAVAFLVNRVVQGLGIGYILYKINSTKAVKKATKVSNAPKKTTPVKKATSKKTTAKKASSSAKKTTSKTAKPTKAKPKAAAKKIVRKKPVKKAT